MTWVNPRPVPKSELKKWVPYPMATGPLIEDDDEDESITFRDVLINYIDMVSESSSVGDTELAWLYEVLDQTDQQDTNGFKWVALSEEQKIEKHCLRDYHEKGDLTKLEWRAIKTAWRGKCCYCGRVCKKPHIEHIRPVFYGGSTTLDNIVPACKECNMSKGIDGLIEFLGEREAFLFNKRYDLKVKLARRLIGMEKWRRALLS